MNTSPPPASAPRVSGAGGSTSPAPAQSWTRRPTRLRAGVRPGQRWRGRACPSACDHGVRPASRPADTRPAGGPDRARAGTTRGTLSSPPRIPLARPAPTAEPPYQDVHGVGPGPAGTAGGSTASDRSGQPELPLTHLLDSGVAAVPAPPAGVAAAGPTPGSDLPDPAGHAARLAQGVLEALAGDRPTGQLLPWTTRKVHADLARHLACRGRLPDPGGAGRGRVAVCRVLVSRPADDVAEVSAVVRNADRRHALAFRLEHRDERWLCTALEFG